RLTVLQNHIDAFQHLLDQLFYQHLENDQLINLAIPTHKIEWSAECLLGYENVLTLHLWPYLSPHLYIHYLKLPMFLSSDSPILSSVFIVKIHAFHQRILSHIPPTCITLHTIFSPILIFK